MQYYRNYSLKKYNSFGLDSIAKEIWFPKTIEELQSIVIELKNRKFEVLSNGTNVLLKPIIDRVICLNSMGKFIRLYPMGIDVSANLFTSSLVLKSIQNGITGFEGLYGIPGTIGGAITMNSGSGKDTISDCLISVVLLDISDGLIFTTNKEYFDFKRRYSTLQDGKEIVISALFKIGKGKVDKIKLNQIKDYRMDFPKGYSAGGIFKNWYALKPYEKEIRAIKSPNLIISKYLNVIINNGKATFQETIEFINRIRKIVKEPLELEVKILG